MKIRSGFVSNSSSSSFLIYGVSLENCEVLSILKNMDKFKDEYEDNIDVCEELRALFNDSNIDVECSNDYNYFIGASWSEVKDDETGKEFKDRVEKKIVEVFGDVEFTFGTHKEAWFNG